MHQPIVDFNNALTFDVGEFLFDSENVVALFCVFGCKFGHLSEKFCFSICHLLVPFFFKIKVKVSELPYHCPFYLIGAGDCSP